MLCFSYSNPSLYACLFDINRSNSYGNSSNIDYYFVRPSESVELINYYSIYQYIPITYYSSYYNTCNQEFLWDFQSVWQNNQGVYYPTLGNKNKNPLLLSESFYWFQLPESDRVIQNRSFYNLNTSNLVFPKSLNTDSDFHLAIYPNPTNGIVWIDQSTTPNKEVEVFSVNGKFLFKTKKNGIDLSSYSNGVYFIKVNGIVSKIILSK